MPTENQKIVPEALAGARLDAAVRALYETTWGRARELVARGKISVDGDTTTDPGARVAAGGTVALRMDAPRQKKENDLDPRAIVHLDEWIVVVVKPAGMSTVPFEGRDPDTLDNRLRGLLARLDPDNRARRGARPALGVVHRLDRGTSGLLVFARTFAAKEKLAVQFRAHTAHRRYTALVHGLVETGTLASHLVVDRGDGLRGSLEAAPRRRKGSSSQGKRAVTHVEVVEVLRGATLVACRLETGRTHQIRIHLGEAGHPIVGERVYVRDYAGPIIEAPRPMLHAAELGFVHPQTGADMRFEAPLPADMKELIRRLRGR
ncbi:MAG: RluA family pseudouridine synthase [Deltaproteobacteria bacterium]|nr:RluA family pseudouridine synthase [Deltaproteobacteria bacterium]